MNGLIVSELRRATSRRILKLFGAIAIGGILIAAITVSFRSSPPSADGRAEIARYEAEVQRCIEGRDPGFQDFQVPDEEREDFCRYSGFVPPPRNETFFFNNMDGVTLGVSVPLIMVTFLIGASLVGAEWRSGTMTTLLTWEPNRLRLFLTKLAVAVVVCVGFALAIQLILLLLLLPVAAARGSVSGLDGEFFRSLTGVMGRAALMVAFSSAIGFAIGATGRNTAAALGVGFVYIAVVEGFLTGMLPWFRPWSVVGNAIIWMSGETSREIDGRSVVGAGVLLVAYAAGVSAAATAIFRTRDVT